MITRHVLADYLWNYLSCAAFQDYAPNGIQIEGTDTIQRVCTAVTASADVIAQAIAWKADALLVHHGYFWRGETPEIVGMKKQRIAVLLKEDINLFAYHLPLDCHVEIGNNACLGRLLNVHDMEQQEASKTKNLLWSGRLARSYTPTDFLTYLQQCLQREPLWIGDAKRSIQRIAWCTGGAQDLIEQAHAWGADAYISGEVSERTYYQARELGVHYFACGHHATERYGIQALGDHLTDHFDLTCRFIDSENPV